MVRVKGLIGFAAVGMAALLLGACTPRIQTHGNLPDPDRLADIKPGQISRDEVEEILGSPSSIALFDKETWYYVSERTETSAFFAPEVKERKVIIVKFEPNGVVSSVDTKGLDDGRVIQPVERETPTAGTEMTLIQQMFGNIGRFNKPDSPQ